MPLALRPSAYQELRSILVRFDILSPDEIDYAEDTIDI